MLILVVENNMRQTIDNYFLDIVKVIGSRGTCDRGKAGCIIVKDKQILSTGYVGSPKGSEHCDDIGHEFHTTITKENGEIRETQHCIRTTHAEQNAICQAAKNGIAIKDSTIYCTMVPCYTCAKMIINSGIIRVIAEYDYQLSENTKNIFKSAKIDLIIINNKTLNYGK